MSMLRLVLFSALTLTVLLASQLAAPPPPAPQLEAGGCGWWQCSLGGELVPSSYVCATQCAGGTCRPVNICE
jgi:hypothetical protein